MELHYASYSVELKGLSLENGCDLFELEETLKGSLYSEWVEPRGVVNGVASVFYLSLGYYELWMLEAVRDKLKETHEVEYVALSHKSNGPNVDIEFFYDEVVEGKLPTHFLKLTVKDKP